MPQSQGRSRQDFSEIVVFTGDLVGSSRLSPDDLSEALRALETGSRALARLPGSAPGWEPRFSSFRGDGWQCVGPEPRFALRGALILRAFLGMLGRPFDTRISVGIGSGWLTDAPNLDIASGTAFELSGRSLDALKGPHRLAIAWEDAPRTAPLLRAILALCDEVSRKWTPKQAEVFTHILPQPDRPNQETLARTLGRTQQTVAEHLTGGGDWALQEALRAMEGS